MEHHPPEPVCQPAIHSGFGATIYAGGALRDAKVDITTVFNCGAVGLVVCAILLWFVREPALRRISAA